MSPETLHTFFVGQKTAGLRLDVALSKFLEMSRAQAHRLIRRGSVDLPGLPKKKIKPSLKVLEGQAVKVHLPQPEPLLLEPEALPLEILYQDSALAVVHKPRGIVVHPSPGHSSGTLVHALLHHLDSLSGIGGVLRPGIVHRLDLTTSGLLVVAKTDAAHQHLSEQFRQRTAGRIYTALCWGGVRDVIRVDEPIGRHPKERKRMAVVLGGKPARTTFFPLEPLGPATLLEARLETGRTHQIRVHLAHLRRPVVGDRVYGAPRLPRRLPGSVREAIELLGGCALHARVLRFLHPRTGQEQQFEAPLPKDFAALLDRMRAIYGK